MLGQSVTHRLHCIAPSQQALRFVKAGLSPMKPRLSMLIVEDQDVMRRMLVEYVQSAYPDIIIMVTPDGV